jgi:outer membrane receptor for ferric coprogen and ferric-rhodotorulic acid
VARWLWADGDLNLSRGRLRDEPAGADRIPLAPTRVASAGLTVRDAGAVGGGVRLRHVGSRAANAANTITARGYALTELFGAWRLAHTEVRLTVDNLFGVTWNEAQFATLSRLPGESPAGVEELHFTPGAPRAVQLAVAYRF